MEKAPPTVPQGVFMFLSRWAGVACWRLSYAIQSSPFALLCCLGACIYNGIALTCLCVCGLASVSFSTPAIIKPYLCLLFFCKCWAFCYGFILLLCIVSCMHLYCCHGALYMPVCLYMHLVISPVLCWLCFPASVFYLVSFTSSALLVITPA